MVISPLFTNLKKAVSFGIWIITPFTTSVSPFSSTLILEVNVMTQRTSLQNYCNDVIAIILVLSMQELSKLKCLISTYLLGIDQTFYIMNWEEPKNGSYRLILGVSKWIDTAVSLRLNSLKGRVVGDLSCENSFTSVCL